MKGKSTILILVAVLGLSVTAGQGWADAADDFFTDLLENWEASQEEAGTDAFQETEGDGSGGTPFEEYNQPPRASVGQTPQGHVDHPICPGSLGNLTLEVPTNVQVTSGMHHIRCRYVEELYFAGHYQTYIRASFTMAWVEEPGASKGIVAQLCIPSFLGWEQWRDNGKVASVTDTYLHDDLMNYKDLFLAAVNQGLDKAEARAMDCPGRGTGTSQPQVDFSEADFEGLEPDPDSCNYIIGSDPGEFDLAYDDEMLRREFLDFLKDYMEKNQVYSASAKYARWDPAHFGKLGWFMFTTNLESVQDSEFMTGTEGELAERVTDRSRREGRPLRPSEVLEESLEINDNNLYDALLTGHNYLKQRGYDNREVHTRSWNDSYNSLTEQKANLETKLQDPALTQEKRKEVDELLAKRQTEIMDMEAFRDRSEATFEDELMNLRDKDNEGAWYHLFGTMTTGYAERENTWRWFGDSAYTRLEVWGEHRIWKGIVGGEGPISGIDIPEYCWDVWGGYLGGELHNALGENQARAFDKIRQDPDLWGRSCLEASPSRIRDGFNGRDLLEGYTSTMREVP